ncbi:MAG: YceI family protein [Pseudomonadota bacterium]
MSTQTPRYTAVAILLHWAIAFAIVGQIALGWWMGDAMSDPARRAQAFAAIQLHKSIGLTILALSLIRLGWRLSHRAPPLPEHMPAWERLVARASHWLFYAIIILYPMTGWLYVSTGWSAFDNHAFDVPTYYFGLFHVPHLFGLNHASDATRSALAHTMFFTHEKLAWLTIAVLVLHVAAALKHHFVNRDEVLAHMVPGLKPRDAAIEMAPATPARRNLLIGGFALIALAGLALVSAFLNPPAPHAPPAAPTAETTAPFADTTTSAVATTTTAQTAVTTTAATTTATTTHATPTAPSTWRVDPGQSAISFSSSVAGANFDGGFSRWHADIRFDPQNLAQSHAEVTIEANSIHTGDAQRDQALPEAEWFDVGSHPTATFRTTSITARGGNRYEAHGTLTIKGASTPVTLPFTLTINGDHASMRGQLSLDRLALNLGKASFPDESQVPRAVSVSVHVEATRSP